MKQLHLFPLLGAIQEPLPDEVLREARERLAELLSEVIAPPNDPPQRQEEQTDE